MGSEDIVLPGPDDGLWWVVERPNRVWTAFRCRGDAEELKARIEAKWSPAPIVVRRVEALYPQ